MEKIIFRKFLYDFLTFFLVVSLSLSLITWIIQSVNYLDFISKDGHGFSVYFGFISLNFPKIFSKIVIFSYFVSLFYTIQKYQSNNEILIFWTNGISRIKLVNFVVKISILITIFQIILVYFLVPKAQDYSRDFIRTSNIDFFTSLITEKKFIDTVKNFTIYVENIDEEGNMENLFLKDSVDNLNPQIITAKSGKIIETESEKFLSLKFGQILDVQQDDFGNTKVIKFNSTTFSLSNLKSKSTTFPKLQELDSHVLIKCINNYFFGKKIYYILPIFHCSESSSIKGAKEIFNRSLKQIYIILLGLIATILIFTNENSPKQTSQKLLIFFIGIICIILSEINSEFLNISIINNIFFMLLPLIIFFILYLFIFNLNQKNI